MKSRFPYLFPLPLALSKWLILKIVKSKIEISYWSIVSLVKVKINDLDVKQEENSVNFRCTEILAWFA